MTDLFQRDTYSPYIYRYGFHHQPVRIVHDFDTMRPNKLYRFSQDMMILTQNLPKALLETVYREWQTTTKLWYRLTVRSRNLCTI